MPPEFLYGLAVGCGLLAAMAGAGWWMQHRRARALARSLEAATHAADTTIDPKAGLVTRAEFDAALEAAARRCKERKGSLSLMVIDLDGFALVNESHGHRVGDRVLREVGRRVRKAAPGKAVVMRLGADEFVLMLEAAADQAQHAAKAIRQALADPVQVGEHKVLVTASVGIAQYPEHGSRSRLLGLAGSAMREVKAAGGNDWAIYDASSQSDLKAQEALLADLRQAIERRQLELFYQPKIDARSLQVTAAEALLRWHHPKQGMVSPGIFIPLAERHGLMAAIGDWVIQEACRQAGQWKRAGLRMRVAINLSPCQMKHDDVVPRLEAALKANALDPDRFTVEITESLALDNTRATQRTFEALRRAGLHVAIDDFGAGQTSLAYLRRLPVSELKMDMTLVQEIAASTDARVIAEAVIKMAHALEMRVVAEGVETPAQRDALVRLGADELQGYLFARPMSARAFGLWALDPGSGQAGPSGAFRASLYVTRQVTTLV